jgi:hypothetical protein
MSGISRHCHQRISGSIPSPANLNKSYAHPDCFFINGLTECLLNDQGNGNIFNMICLSETEIYEAQGVYIAVISRLGILAQQIVVNRRILCSYPAMLAVPCLVL